MPILSVPLERIERQSAFGNDEGYADDRHINEEAVKSFVTVIQRGRLEQAPFFRSGAWHFVNYIGEPINLARGMPEGIASQLADKEAAKRAAKMNANQWISILRNALAHGGIAYLNENGRSADGEPVKMLAFASGKFREGACPNDKDKRCRGQRGDLDALRILRIREEDYLEFLQQWVSWLSVSGIAHSTAA